MARVDQTDNYPGGKPPGRGIRSGLIVWCPPEVTVSGRGFFVAACFPASARVVLVEGAEPGQWLIDGMEEAEHTARDEGGFLALSRCEQQE